jgi:hypothetical protein
MTRRNEAPPRGQKHDTRLVRFRKHATLHPKQLHLLKALDHWKGQNPGLKIASVKLSSPKPPVLPSAKTVALHPRHLNLLSRLSELVRSGKLSPNFRLHQPGNPHLNQGKPRPPKPGAPG